MANICCRFKVNGLSATFILSFAALLLSQSAMDVFFSILAIWGVFAAFSTKRPLSMKLASIKLGNGLDACLWGFLLVVVMGLLLSPVAPTSTIVEQLWQQRWLLFIYPLAFLLRNHPLQKLHMFFAAMLFSAIAWLENLWFLSQKWHSLGEARLDGFHQNAMTHAHLFACIGAFFCGLFIYFFRQLTFQQRLWGALLLLGTALNLLLSLTRGVWLATFVAVLSMAFWRNRKLGISLLLVGIAGVVTLMIASPAFKNRILQVTQYQKNYDSERVVLYTTNWRIFLTSPVLGIGYNENRRRLRQFFDEYNVPQGQFESHAHNQYLHLLAGTGILGLAFYLAIFVLVLRQVFKQLRRESFGSGLAFALFGSWLCFAIGGLTEANLEHWKMKYYVALWAAMALALSQISQSRAVTATTAAKEQEIL